MNGNSDKHKPLSPEELFRRLETGNQGALPDGELDDFEKEALEGFSAHTSPEKARHLTGEVQDLIHKTIHEPEKKRSKGRIIWFGAAASLVLGLIISAYVLVQHADNSPELALNKNVSDEPVPGIQAFEEPSATGIAEEESKTESLPEMPARDVVAAQSPSEQSVSISKNSGTYEYKQEDANLLRNDQSVEGLEKSKDPSAKNQAQATTGYVDKFKSAEASPLQEDLKVEISTKGMAANNKALAPGKGDPIASTPPAEKTEKESSAITYESVEPVSTKTKQSPLLKKRKKAAEDSQKDAAPASSSPAKTGEQKVWEENTRTAYDIAADYYTGGEQALKTNVVAWLREHGYEGPKGTYRIRMSIRADGTAEVLELKAEKDGDERMINPLEKSLNALKGWIAGTGHEATFSLSF